MRENPGEGGVQDARREEKRVSRRGNIRGAHSSRREGLQSAHTWHWVALGDLEPEQFQGQAGGWLSIVEAGRGD